MAKTRIRAFRFELIWSLIGILLAFVLAFIPMLNLLGYEYATAYCLFAIVASGSIALRRLGDGTFRLGHQPTPVIFVGLAGRANLPLVLPPLVSLANALIVPNCDIGIGILLFLLLPVLTVPVIVVSAMTGAAILKSRRWRVFFYVMVVLLSAISSAIHIFTEPPIFAYHPFVGYFSGSIYDEALTLPPGLLPFRLMCLAFVGAVLSAIDVAYKRARREPLATAVVAFFAASTIWGVVYTQRFDLRIESTRDDIIEALGGIAESEHFIIYYPLSSSTIASNIDDIVDDHEFRYSQLRDYFGVEPELPLRSFIYASQSQKERMMGANRTLIAKPWLGEMHITYRAVGDGHLAHEMAHLFSAAFGSGPLELAAGGGLITFDMGLIEGAAEAASWDAIDLTMHGWAAAMIEAELAPNIEDIAGTTGFWSSYSRTVYTLMGSFSRWLIAEHGIERFRHLYATGDFEETYGESAQELASVWSAFLAELPLSERDIELTRFRYDRPAIFSKRCARSVAALAREGWAFAGGQRYGEAAECFADVVEDDPDNIGYRLEYARILRQAGDYLEAETVAAWVEGSQGVGRVYRAQAMELLGDIAWSSGQLDAAFGYYQQVVEEPLLEDDLRRVTVKLWAVQNPSAAQPVFLLFLASPPPHRDSMTVTLSQTEASTGEPMLTYLMGMRMFNANDYEQAVSFFEDALGGFSSQPDQLGLFAIRRMTQLRAGQSRFFIGDYQQAIGHFQSVADGGDPLIDSRSAEALDWIERCHWQANEE